MHRFPKNNEHLFRTWLESIKPANYENMTQQQIYDKYYVCEAHFSPNFIVQGTKRGLAAMAVPSLNLPEK